MQLIEDRVKPSDLESRLRMRVWALITLATYGADRYGIYRQVTNKTVSTAHCPMISLAVDSGGAVTVNNLYVAAPLIPQESRTNA